MLPPDLHVLIAVHSGRLVQYNAGSPEIDALVCVGAFVIGFSTLFATQSYPKRVAEARSDEARCRPPFYPCGPARGAWQEGSLC